MCLLLGFGYVDTNSFIRCMLFPLNQTLQIIKQILMFIHTSFSVLDFIGLELGLEQEPK